MGNIDFDHKLTKEQKKNTAILATDLSAAFATVDHEILLKKLSHYGVGKNAIDLIRSFLSDRKCFVELQGFKSQILQCLPCSVIQG